MDMTSFPKMLQFKQMMIPNPQLLRWSDWFSQWSFDVIHVKGKDNVIADFFSRPSVSTLCQPHSVLPCIYPLFPVDFHNDAISLLPQDIQNEILNFSL